MGEWGWGGAEASYAAAPGGCPGVTRLDGGYLEIGTRTRLRDELLLADDALAVDAGVGGVFAVVNTERDEAAAQPAADERQAAAPV